MQIANEIPGFAGYYLDGANRQLVVYVKDSSRDSLTAFEAAASAIRAHLASDGLGIPRRQHPVAGVRIRRAQYDFQTLSDYRDFVSDSMLSIDNGVVWVDLDEAINRVSVGVLAAVATTARASVLDRARSHGIPAGALNFQVTDTLRPATLRASLVRPVPTVHGATTTLSDSVDTLGAGFFYHNQLANSDCTIGDIADSGSVRMFVSASHCTWTTFGFDGDTIQTHDGTKFAVERNDPTAASARNSDAASFTLFGGPPYTLRGVIARLNTRDSVGLGAPRDTSINTSNRWLYAYAIAGPSDIVSGERVDKVGAFGGWVYGTVNNTCTDVTIATRTGNKTIHCEAIAPGLANRQGDSGGPVFIWDGIDGAILVGTTTALDGSQGTWWGGSESVGSTFSYMTRAISELGPLNVLTGTTVSTPSLTGDVSGGNANASWAAVSTTNTTAATIYEIWEWTWDASTQTWDENEQFIGTTTGLFYDDVSAPWTLLSVAGAGQPEMCNYSSVGIEIRAYNEGAYAYSGTLWFQGPKNGAGPAC
ncbi:MAG: hypothetical protein ACREN6_12995 [Gemmatimonadaceae bacterium]